MLKVMQLDPMVTTLPQIIPKVKVLFGQSKMPFIPSQIIGRQK